MIWFEFRSKCQIFLLCVKIVCFSAWPKYRFQLGMSITANHFELLNAEWNSRSLLEKKIHKIIFIFWPFETKKIILWFMNFFVSTLVLFIMILLLKYHFHFMTWHSTAIYIYLMQSYFKDMFSFQISSTSE